jgi:hypothetical protein
VGLRGCSIVGSDGTSPAPTVGGAADKLPDELWAKVLAKVLEFEQSAPCWDGWSGSKDSAAVRLVCSGWQAVHDAMVKRLVLKKKATDEGMGVLARRFPAVLSLDFNLNRFGEENELTDEGLKAVSGLTSLTSLFLCGSYAVTDVGMRAVSNLPALTSLDLSYCVEVADETLRAVSSMPALAILNLTFCQKVTDETLRAVSSMPALSVLDISYCNVTAAGVQALCDTTAAPDLNIWKDHLVEWDDDTDDDTG